MVEFNPWDVANGFFEGVGSILTWLNIRRLYLDKEVKGVQWQVTIFWTAWGIFNLFFYGPALGLWISWTMGYSIVVANTVWVGMVVYYLHQRRKQTTAAGIILPDRSSRTGGGTNR